jgi:hypothetical protein
MARLVPDGAKLPSSQSGAVLLELTVPNAGQWSG